MQVCCEERRSWRPPGLYTWKLAEGRPPFPAMALLCSKKSPSPDALPLRSTAVVTESHRVRLYSDMSHIMNLKDGLLRPRCWYRYLYCIASLQTMLPFSHASRLCLEFSASARLQQRMHVTAGAGMWICAFPHAICDVFSGDWWPTVPAWRGNV